MSEPLQLVHDEVVVCRRCPRLIAWREAVGQVPPPRYAGQSYWARPVPSWGDSAARVVIVGLAPAAHGGNRTGRIFTGDRSGDWLFRALYKAGYANQPTSVAADDGLQLHGCFICAACHCAPPANKPLPSEIGNCRPYLLRELHYFFGASAEISGTDVSPAAGTPGVVVGLGKIGFDAAFDAVRALGLTALKARPRFGHGVAVALNPSLWLLGTFHPSQQNTFTGKLTEAMFDAVWVRARTLARDTGRPER